MYRYRYINKHFQFGYTTYTLVLEDLEDNLPLVRLDKSFNLDPSLIDENFLYEEARKDILSVMQQINDNTLGVNRLINNPDYIQPYPSEPDENVSE